MPSASNALERLIQQFAQPLAFLRELVQNSLDADTTTVEIETGFDRPSDCCFLTIRDNGSGMTEEIIDRRLTRLFSSTKEDDLTKIGKFGIGFVSIFAVNPELVVLETGCEGESWRVLFKPDRSFEKRRLQERVEGTAVTLYLSRPQTELEELSRKARETVVFWCKFSETQILFHGEPLNQVFGFPEALYQYRFREGNTEAAMFPAPEFGGYHGYYNRGLTLLEGPGSPLAHVAFRVRSPYLEHTLSRDNILKDGNYEKILQLLTRAAYEDMPRDIFTQLAQVMSTSNGQRDSLPSPSVLWELASMTLKLSGSHSIVGDIKVFPGRGEEMLSLDDLPDAVYFHSEVDDFWNALEGLELPLLRLEFSKSLEVLERAGRRVLEISDWFYHYELVKADREQSKLLAALVTEVSSLSCFLVEFKNQPVESETLAFYLSPVVRARGVEERERGGHDQIGLVASHPLFMSVLRLANVEMDLALSILVRKIHLDLNLPHKSEGQLLAKILKRLQAEAKN